MYELFVFIFCSKCSADLLRWVGRFDIRHIHYFVTTVLVMYVDLFLLFFCIHYICVWVSMHDWLCAGDEN